MARGGKIRIGISGWRYEPWRGAFYPEKLPQKSELSFAAGKFNSLEINGTFYSLQRPSSFAGWKADTPDDFVFSVKCPRFITHIRRLREVEMPLANFLASGVLLFEKKLGPFLWQLPPNFKYQKELFENFFKLLPMDSATALNLARSHDRIKTDEGLEVSSEFPVRHAIEIRNKSFANEEFIALLRRYNVGLVCADTPAWPRLMDLTSNFVYCRLHGSETLYANGYDDKSLDDWARRVTDWAQGREPKDAERVIDQAGPKLATRDVFVYFDNDLKVKAPFDALALTERIQKISGQKAAKRS
ncbi:MAG TPA: DUF72 domain-containing protein [Candidatus Acidoferrum sp.]|nr:DUF72 domain-containing protein [Candidatus Acidoferrum sp.]